MKRASVSTPGRAGNYKVTTRKLHGWGALLEEISLASASYELLRVQRQRECIKACQFTTLRL